VGDRPPEYGKAPPPTDAQLSELVQAMGTTAIAAAFGVAPRTVRRWVEAARARDPNFGTVNARAGQVVAALHAQTDTLRKRGEEIADAAADELLRLIQYTDCFDPRYMTEKMRLLIDLVSAGAAPGLESHRDQAARTAATLSHEDLLERVRQATASAVARADDENPGPTGAGEVPSTHDT